LPFAIRSAPGIDIVSDGEMRRESYFNRLRPRSTASTSIIRVPLISRTGKPRARAQGQSGAFGGCARVNVRDVQFLRANTDRQIKITVPARSR